MARRTVVGTGVLLAALVLAACEPSVDGTSDPEGAGGSTDRTAGDAGGGQRGDASGEISLAFAGDVHFEAHLADLLERRDADLGPISRVLDSADLAMVNLESAITARGTRVTKELEHPADRYWFRSAPAALDVLERSGVDAVSVANNHGADFGEQGFADTLRARDDAEVAVVGAGEDRADALEPHRVSIRGTDVAVLAADASTREGRGRLWSAGVETPGLATARGAAPALVAAVREAAGTADVVVVYLHWGNEYDACPDDAQRALAAALSEAGADVVVGSHAHVQQGAGWLDDTYVGYGLGNFAWYHDAQPETGVLKLRIVDGEVVEDTWVPAEIAPDGLPRPVAGAAAADAGVRWAAHRSCTGLAPRPQGAAAPYVTSMTWIGPALRERMRSSHGPGCPVPWDDLRHLRITYVGFDGEDHVGEMVVHQRRVDEVLTVFKVLYDERWPLRRMRLVSDYAGDDDRSMAADNTSAFNCRPVTGGTGWSDHAYGSAIDLNPVENPYVLGGTVLPPTGRRFAFVDRSPGAAVPRGVISAGDVVVDAFAAAGWAWGGTWSSPDYQHFYYAG